MDEYRVVPSDRVSLSVPLTEVMGELEEEGADVTRLLLRKVKRAADMMDYRTKSQSHLRMRSWRFA